jgi:transmembrane sensor
MEDLIVRVLQGRATPDESDALLRWRESSPENELRYQDLARIWLPRTPVGVPSGRRPAPSAFEIIHAAKQRQQSASPAAPQPQRQGWTRWAGRAAAAVFVAITGFAAATLLQPTQPLYAGGVVSTSAGEMATVTLPDGTLIRLGPSSEVRFGEEPARRDVWLDGEAFLSVARMDDAPFTVRTAAGKVVVLGTRFRVRTSGEAMQVGVLEGRVAVGTGSVERELVGGEIGQVAGGNLRVRRANHPDELRPNLGNFVAFRSTPLWSVAEELELHFGVRVEIRDPDVGGRTVTAAFQDDAFSEVVSDICRITASVCTITDSLAVIAGR